MRVFTLLLIAAGLTSVALVPFFYIPNASLRARQLCGIVGTVCVGVALCTWSVHEYRRGQIRLFRTAKDCWLGVAFTIWGASFLVEGENFIILGDVAVVMFVVDLAGEILLRVMAEIPSKDSGAKACDSLPTKASLEQHTLPQQVPGVSQWGRSAYTTRVVIV